jgi:cell division protein FtsL
MHKVQDVSQNPASGESKQLILIQNTDYRGTYAKPRTHVAFSKGRSFRLGKRSALTVMIVVIVALIIMLKVGSVYAQTLVLTPNPVVQGMNVQVTGNGFQSEENGEIQVYTSSAGSCAAIPSLTINTNTDNDGNLNSVTIPTSGLSAGTYCVEGNGFLNSPDTVMLIVNSSTTATGTVATSAPEYIYILPLVIVMVVAYVVMKRMHLI